MRAPVPTPNRHWQMRREEIDANSEFVNECLVLWDQGLDTKDIASRMAQPEHIVESATRLGRERRRRWEE